MVREANWDVVLLDISMPDMNGIEALTQIKRIKPELPVLILTMHPEDQYAINLLRAGRQRISVQGMHARSAGRRHPDSASGRRYISPALGDQLAGELER